MTKILSKPKPKISIPKKKLKKIKKYFSELRNKFSKEDIDKFRKSFYDIKNHRNLLAAKIREVEKNLLELEESLQFKKFKNDDSNNEYKKRKSVRRLFKGFKDYYKQIKTDDSFDNKKGYTEYGSRGDKQENLSPKEFLDMIRPYLRDMINDHKTPMRLPNNKTTSGEWKIQLIILNKCISNKNFEETRDIYLASNNVEIFMGSDTNNIVDELFKSHLQRFQDAQEKPNERGSKFIHENVDTILILKKA